MSGRIETLGRKTVYRNIMKTGRRRIGLMVQTRLPCVCGRNAKTRGENMTRWNNVGFKITVSVFVLGFVTGCSILSGTPSRDIGDVTALRPAVREIGIVMRNGGSIIGIAADLRRKKYVPIIAYEDFERYGISELRSTIGSQQYVLDKAMNEQNIPDVERWTKRLDISRAALAAAEECIRIRSGKMPAILSYEGDKSTDQEWETKCPLFPSCSQLKEESEILCSPAVLEFVFLYRSERYERMSGSSAISATKTVTLEDLTLTYREAGAVKWRHYFAETSRLYIQGAYYVGESSLSAALSYLPPWVEEIP